MPRNGSGIFTRPVASYVTNTVISSTSVNSEFDGIATALTASIAKDGQTNPTANLPMATFRHTGVGNAAARTDYAAAGQVQDSAFLWGGTAGGTADALTLTLTPAISAYAAGQEFRFIASAANTGAATVAINGLAAAAIESDGSALTAGQIVSGGIYSIIYDGTAFQLSAGFAGAVAGPGSATDNALVRFDGASGKIVQSGTWTENDSGNVNAGGGELYQVVTYDTSGKHQAVGTTASNTTFDVSAYASGSIEPTGNITIAFSNWPATGDAYFTLEGTGLGDHTITWTGVTWDGGAAPPLATTTGVNKIVFFTRDAGSTVRGKLAWSS